MTAEEAVLQAIRPGGVGMDPANIVAWGVDHGDPDGHPPTPSYLVVVYDGELLMNQVSFSVRFINPEE
jgi:hypothetical protein